MKLVTFLPKAERKAETKIGILSDENCVLDLHAVTAFYLQQTGKEKDPGAFSLHRFPGSMAGFLSRGEEAFLVVKQASEFAAKWLKDKKALPKSSEGEDLAFPLSGVDLKPPVPRPGKIIAMGLNFYDHAAENKVRPPKVPVGFLKAATSLTGPGEPVPYPRSTKQLDYEIEMAIVIGKKGKDVPKEKALEYVAGYTILNDLSARDIQSKEMSKRLVLLSKSLDGLGPLGPWLVTKDEISDPNNLAMELYVNHEPEPRQKSNTNQMVFKVADLVSYWSQMTLEPGDIISSGTPGGVGIFRQPPEKWLLKPGDTVEARIEKLGVLRNPIVA
ncbi:MAG: fumarylacetoacetate hydrolase family protein [Deltaproteobacteria bacterium]|nr:fumarylacetoacetate hydrolase family protein [Deltaproteobacteria bacterium]